MAVLNRTFSELYLDVARFAYQIDTGLSSDQSANVKRWVNDGYREFLSAYDWSFLSPNTTLTVWPAVAVADSVTVAASGTTVTATGGTPFYASMVGRTMTVTGIGTRLITGYTSTTVVTVDSTFTGSHTFSIPGGDYGLPENFAALLDHPTIGDGIGYPPLLVTTPEEIRLLRANIAEVSEPMRYALAPRDYVVTTGQRWDMMLYPEPSAERVLGYRCRIEPQAMTADAEYPVGGGSHSLTIQHAALMCAERSLRQTDYWKNQFYGNARAGIVGSLQQSIAHDNRVRPPLMGSLIIKPYEVQIQVGTLTEVVD